VKIPGNERLIAALDLPTAKEALGTVELLLPEVKVFKVGLELFVTAGPSIVSEINSLGGKVFLDLKFFDIPNTMAAAVASASSTGAFMINVHSLAGGDAMKKCEETLTEAGSPTLLIGVTILTSFDKATLTEIGIDAPVENTVSSLCGIALSSGLDGVVASPLETARLRSEFGNDFLVVTPGVRPEWAGADDQKRIATPYNAIKEGADYIVVGRPILKADDPATAARRIQEEIKEAIG
jgi:orotidine-5'-phosphate decarboxylase